jgi:hypothetical protein
MAPLRPRSAPIIVTASSGKANISVPRVASLFVGYFAASVGAPCRVFRIIASDCIDGWNAGDALRSDCPQVQRRHLLRRIARR